jgi:hypothetical protein
VVFFWINLAQALEYTVMNHRVPQNFEKMSASQEVLSYMKIFLLIYNILKILVLVEI